MTILTLTGAGDGLRLSPCRRAGGPLLVQAGLVAEWRFSDGEGQQLTDFSGNGHHGQLGSTGGADADDPTWTAEGLSFDGDDFVEHGTVGDFGDQPRTVLAVVKTGSTFGLEWLGDSGSFTRWTLRRLSGAIRLEVSGAGHSAAFDIPGTDQWFFVGATQSGSNLDTAVIYRDGLSEAVTASAELDTRGNFSWARQFNSTVAMEAAYGLVYDRALTPAEVEHNRQALKTILAPRGITLP